VKFKNAETTERTPRLISFTDFVTSGLAVADTLLFSIALTKTTLGTEITSAVSNMNLYSCFSEVVADVEVVAAAEGALVAVAEKPETGAKKHSVIRKYRALIIT